MAFGNVTTLYIPTANGSAVQAWGTDVRKLLDFADTGFNNATVTNHGTGGEANRTVDPYTTSATSPDQVNFGWAIAPEDMNSVAGALRFFPAGNHTVTVRMVHNGATAATGTLKMSVYRVGPSPTFTRTLLGTGSSSFSMPVTSGEFTATDTVALPEVIFAAGETVQYSFQFSAAGIAVVGRTATFFTGTQSGVATRIAVPKLGVLADTTGTATGLGTASGETGKVLNTIGTATGLGTATGALGATSVTTGSATGAGTATGAFTGIGGMTGTATGSGTASAVVTAIGSMTGTAVGSGDAVGVLGATGEMTGSATGSGDAVGILGATGGMTGTATGSGSASAQASSVAGTTGAAAGSGTATGVLGATGGMTGTATGSVVVTGVFGVIGGMTGTSAGSGVATGVFGTIGGMTGTSAGIGTADGFTSSLSGTTGTAAGSCVVSGLVSRVLGTVGTVEPVGGGGTTVINVIKPFYVFDD